MQKYVINAPAVIAQTVDDETLVVHLERGYYFSLRGSAQEVWSGLAAGAPLEAVLASLEGHYGRPRADLAGPVEAFLAELLSERLLTPSASPAGTDAAFFLAPTAAPAAFVPPALTRYTDIEDMLAVDPIHEVDASGWPRPAER